ncbi:TonB-dependent receptor plug domain-containing protein, partial [Ectothiorhodospira lacustris]|uniref:TonB-dependent receptor plug domain-containing protein n=1 Tax=Ectothiorhodospira lacustris TaxID=2899127 RepID=UPI001EE7D814
MTKMQRFLCIALLLPTGVPADTRTLSEQDFFMELPVALTATRTQQPQIEAPATVTIIDRDWLEHSGARHVADVLAMVPGFLVSHHNGNRRIVTYHGLGGQFSRQIQVLVDGRSVYSPINGGAQWADLPLSLDEIERIEVIRGPNSAAYGSNSFFAIVNILTRHTAETQGTRFNARVGTEGIRDASIRHGGNRDDHLSYRLSLSHLEDDGFADNHDGWTRHSVGLRLDQALTGARALTLDTRLTRLDKGVDAADHPIVPSRDLRFDYGYLQAVLEGHGEPGNGYRLQYYFDQYDLTDRYSLIGPASDSLLEVDQGGRNRRHDLELALYQQLTPDSRLVWGGGLRKDSSRSPYYFSNAIVVENQIQRLFANLELTPATQWLINMGGMYEANDLIKDEFMPRAAVIFMPAPDLSFRLIASRAIRSPSLVEAEVDTIIPTLESLLTGEGGRLAISDPSLRAEIINSVELGSHLQFDHGKGSLDIRLFHNTLERLIQFPVEEVLVSPEDGISMVTNTGKLTLKGMEVHLDYRFSPRTRLSTGISLLDSHGHDPDARTQADSIPKHVLNL